MIIKMNDMSDIKRAMLTVLAAKVFSRLLVQVGITSAIDKRILK